MTENDETKFVTDMQTVKVNPGSSAGSRTCMMTCPGLGLGGISIVYHIASASGSNPGSILLRVTPL